VVAGMCRREACRIDAEVEAADSPCDEELSDERINQAAGEPFRGLM